MSKERVGFIGTGIMGRPMACNLLKAGYSLTVHNRTKAKAQPLLDKGAIWAPSSTDIAKGSDVVITCVTDTPDVKEVLLGENGVILIDAPISGGETGAIEGKLSIMMGGPKEIVEKVRPIMEVMGRTVVYCGPLGCGQMTKLANQVMVIHTIMSISEGLAFAEKAGLDLETTLKVTSAGAAGSYSLKALGPKIIAGDFKPAFMVDLQQKDLRLVLEYAEQLKLPLPGVALAKQLLAALQAQGRGRDGTQALIDVIRQLGTQITQI